MENILQRFSCISFLFKRPSTNSQQENSNFYGLPKFHKPRIISKAIEEQGSEYISYCQLKDLKLRPIVAGHKCPTKTS